MGQQHSGRVVFLDTQVFVQQNFQYDRGLLDAFSQHVKAGRLHHVTTDVTVGEVRAELVRAVENARLALKRFQTDARVLRNLPSPRIARFFRSLHRRDVLRELQRQFDAFLEETKSTLLSSDSVRPAVVFGRYFEGLPPFSNPKKKEEFPDAFAMEAILGFVRESGHGVTVVSRDSDWSAFAETEPKVQLVDRLEDLLQICLQDSPLLEVAAAVLKRLQPVVEKMARDECQGLSFYVADGQATVVDVKPTHVSLSGPAVIANATTESILFSADLRVWFQVSVEYTTATLAAGPRPFDLRGEWAPRQIRSQVSDEIPWASESFRLIGTVSWNASHPEESSVSSVSITDPKPVAVFLHDYGST